MFIEPEFWKETLAFIFVGYLLSNLNFSLIYLLPYLIAYSMYVILGVGNLTFIVCVIFLLFAALVDSLELSLLTNCFLKASFLVLIKFLFIFGTQPRLKQFWLIQQKQKIISVGYQNNSPRNV